MTADKAIAEAKRRSQAGQECIDVWFDADLFTPDWRNRYIVCRHIDRPAHGRQIGTAYNAATFLTVEQ